MKEILKRLFFGCHEGLLHVHCARRCQRFFQSEVPRPSMPLSASETSTSNSTFVRQIRKARETKHLGGRGCAGSGLRLGAPSHSRRGLPDKNSALSRSIDEGLTSLLGCERSLQGRLTGQARSLMGRCPLVWRPAIQAVDSFLNRPDPVQPSGSAALNNDKALEDGSHCRPMRDTAFDPTGAAPGRGHCGFRASLTDVLTSGPSGCRWHGLGIIIRDPFANSYRNSCKSLIASHVVMLLLLSSSLSVASSCGSSAAAPKNFFLAV